MQELKRLQMQITTTKSELSKVEETLQDRQEYETFLKQVHRQKRLGEIPKVSGSSADLPNSGKTESNAKNYFSEPEELLDVFDRLAKKNLRLIETRSVGARNRAWFEENFKGVQTILSEEVSRLEEEIKKIEGDISTWEDRLYRMEKANLDLEASSQAEDIEIQEQLSVLGDLVSAMFTEVIGSNMANLSTLQMLELLERYLQDVVETANELPSHQVKSMYKIRHQQRQQKMREARLLAQRKKDVECPRFLSKQASTLNPSDIQTLNTIRSELDSFVKKSAD